jgi:hypothetical protein
MELLRTDPIQRGQGAVEDMVSPLEATAFLNRDENIGFLDHTDFIPFPARISAYTA